MNTKTISIKKQKVNKNKNINLSEQKQQLLKEGIVDTVNLLKKYRKKYETLEAKQYFEEIKQMELTNVNDLNKITKLFQKHFPQINIAQQYVKTALEYSKEIYNILYNMYAKIILDASGGEDITVNKNKELEKESFLFASTFLYFTLNLNDEEELEKVFNKIKQKAESIDTHVKITALSVFSQITLMLLHFIFTFNISYIISYMIISSFLSLFPIYKFQQLRKKLIQTGDVI